MEQEDQILLDELKQGDRTAYAQLFHKYYKPMVAKAFFMVDDEMKAEDLVQSLFVDIWQKQHYQSINTSLKAYLFRALHNRCLISIDAKKKDEKRFKEYQPAEETEVNQEYEDIYYAQLHLVLNELPQKRQLALRLVHLEDKRYKQAAEEMGISVNSIKTHLKLAIRVLQEKLINFK